MTHPHNGVRFIHEKEDFYELIWSDFQDLFLNEKSKVQTILCIILHSLQGGRKEKQTTNKKKSVRINQSEIVAYRGGMARK